mmetsp:Transcript_132130/g.423258  ORF Transcript_132130/g.423258 Transcript_132130/m.423258 type:complete len:294 (-) Transcript_132130:1761-2642(-)
MAPGRRAWVRCSPCTTAKPAPGRHLSRRTPAAACTGRRRVFRNSWRSVARCCTSRSFFRPSPCSRSWVRLLSRISGSSWTTPARRSWTRCSSSYWHFSSLSCSSRWLPTEELTSAPFFFFYGLGWGMLPSLGCLLHQRHDGGEPPGRRRRHRQSVPCCQIGCQSGSIHEDREALAFFSAPAAARRQAPRLRRHRQAHRRHVDGPRVYTGLMLDYIHDHLAADHQHHQIRGTGLVIADVGGAAGTSGGPECETERARCADQRHPGFLHPHDIRALWRSPCGPGRDRCAVAVANA